MFQQDLQKQRQPKSNYVQGGRLRFNIIFNFIVIGFILIPFFVPIIYSIGIIYYFCLQWTLFFILYLKNTIILSQRHKANKDDQNKQLNGQTQKSIRTEQEQFTNYKHIMMTFVYKEPLDLLCNTIKNIQQMQFSQQFIVLIGMEERTPDKDNQIMFIQEKFKNVFQKLIITIHPFGIEGEIPGKCSNCNYAQRQIVEYLKSSQDLSDVFNPEDYFLTNFDVDTRFQYGYIKELENQIQIHCNKFNIDKYVWQPTVFYNWNLNQRNIFVVIISLLRNMCVMGVMVPFELNLTSIFSISLKLCINGDYTDPAYQSDDIICYIRYFSNTRQNIKLRMVYSATLSGPTNGETFYQQLSEWAQQLKRWTIGSAEVFHYYIIKQKNVQPNLKYTILGIFYLNYYAAFLISQSFFNISFFISTIIYYQDESIQLQIMQACALGFQYVLFILILVVNQKSQWMLQDIIDSEQINIIKILYQILISPVIFISCAFVACYAIFEMIIKGKQVCNHIPSKKIELV